MADRNCSKTPGDGCGLKWNGSGKHTSCSHAERGNDLSLSCTEFLNSYGGPATKHIAVGHGSRPARMWTGKSGYIRNNLSPCRDVFGNIRYVG